MHLRNRVNGALPPEVLLSSCEVRAGGSVLKAELPGDRVATSPRGRGMRLQEPSGKWIMEGP